MLDGNVKEGAAPDAPSRCPSCGQPASHESLLWAAIWLDTPPRFSSVKSCALCFHRALRTAMGRIEVSHDAIDLTDLALVLERHAVIIHEFRRGDDALVVRPMLIAVLKRIEAGFLDLQEPTASSSRTVADELEVELLLDGDKHRVTKINEAIGRLRAVAWNPATRTDLAKLYLLKGWSLIDIEGFDESLGLAKLAKSADPLLGDCYTLQLTAAVALGRLGEIAVSLDQGLLLNNNAELLDRARALLQEALTVGATSMANEIVAACARRCPSHTTVESMRAMIAASASKAQSNH